MNCDCTAEERRMYSENEDLEIEVERLRSERRWILVSDRLPPLLTEVLGWHPDDRARAWFRHSGTVQGGPRAGTYWESWSPQDRECDDCEVDAPTHWMPLPEPPGSLF
jgi:hypothetical protein